ncbi:hypothetical protein [Pseudovibrio sp. Alg231-02]|nr:hypothetical protein [Pseudovibrio sp. Alg231-02]
MFLSRQSRQDGSAPVYTRQRIGQIVQEIAKTLTSPSVFTRIF